MTEFPAADPCPWPVECQTFKDSKGVTWYMTPDGLYWTTAAIEKLAPTLLVCSRCECPLHPDDDNRYFCVACRGLREAFAEIEAAEPGTTPAYFWKFASTRKTRRAIAIGEEAR
jgi:hypothetical protein